MKDTQKVLRWAIFRLLHNQIIYEGNIIPVSDEKVKLGEGDSLYVLFSTQQEQDLSTDDAFITRSSIDIEITYRAGYEITKDFVDDVSNILLEILMPSPMSDILTEEGWLISGLHRESSISRNVRVSDTETVVSKIITLSATITQQFP